MHHLNNYFIADSAEVRGDVVLSAGVNIWYNCVVRGDLARISLADNVNLQDGTILHTDTDEPMDLAEGVVVGHGVILHGRSIGGNSLIGMGAILLSGSEIGEECLIAAGTLITQNCRIPPRSVVMGVPGRVYRALRPEELEETKRICQHYREMAQRHADGEFPRIRSK